MGRTSQEVTCKECQKSFLKALKEIRRSPNHFCSRSCSVIYQNRHKKSNFKRSKFEIKLEEYLKDKLPDLEMNFNDRLTVGLELDLYIPSQKLAFEFNGISHKKAIYGPEVLQKTLRTDQRKRELCDAKGIRLVIIDITSMPHFRFYKFEIFAKQILDEIQKSK